MAGSCSEGNSAPKDANFGINDGSINGVAITALLFSYPRIVAARNAMSHLNRKAPLVRDGVGGGLLSRKTRRVFAFFLGWGMDHSDAGIASAHSG